MKTLRVFCVVLLYLGATIPTWSQVALTTERYDSSRTGANLNETTLTTSNVKSTLFGKLYSYSVEGSVYAQPLYVPQLTLPGLGTYNVLFVPTMNDVVYALDADSNATNGNGVLWMKDFTNTQAGVTPIPIADIVSSNSLNIVGNVGIESTPVIDLTTKTMYLVARTKEVSGNTTSYVARLHALDITTGNEKFGGPIVIRGSVAGTGPGNSGGVLTFDPLIHNQRSSLALGNGVVVFSWASHEDEFNWHGWVFAYTTQTLQPAGIYCTTPNGQNGGLWMSGRAPVVDSGGNLYYASGNGDWDGNTSFGDSVLKLSATGGAISLADYFTPDDYASLQSGDVDLGSSGPFLIPGTNFLVHGGKQSVVYLFDISKGLGHEQSGNGQIVQSFTTQQGGEIHGGPVFWNRTTGAGPTMYVWPNNAGSLEAYQFNGSTFNTAPISRSTVAAPAGQSGGVLTLSANGSTVGSGIVWSSMPINRNGDHGQSSGILRAFDANNLTTELWDSEMDSSRDSLGNWPKYSPPTVENGRVYMAAFPSDGVSVGIISVYGLLAQQDFSLTATPGTQTVVQGSGTTYTASIGAVAGFTGTVTLSASGLPAGVTATFSPTTVTGSGSSTLTVTTSGTTPIGTSPLTITGTSGSLTHSAGVTLAVIATPPPPDYTLSATPGSQTVVGGSSTTYTTSIGALNGFGGVVTLSASGLPAGATATFSPATVTGTGTSILTVTTTSGTTPVGTSSLTITGTSGSLTHSANVTLSVTNAAAIGIKFVGQGTAMGSSESAGVVPQSNWNNATGMTSSTPLALLNQAGAASGATVTWNTNGIWVLPITDSAGNNRMMRGYLDTTSGPTTVTVTGLPANAAGYNVYVYADGDNSGVTRTGAYQISGSGIATTSVNLTDAAGVNFTGTFTQANNSNGNYVLFPITATGFTITATPGATTNLPRAPLNAIQIVPLTTPTPDFSLTASPSTQSVVVGSAATYTAGIGALNGFAGIVTLSAGGLPAGATATFSPATVTGSGTSTLTVTTSGTTPVGTSPLTITGTSGTLIHTAGMTLTTTATPPPPDFSLSATPGTATVVQGSGTTYTASIGAVAGFTGTVTLSASGLPAGVTATFSPTTVTGSGSSTLTVTTSGTTPIGTSPLTITGTSGSLTHSAGVTLAVIATPPPPDYTLSATPGSQTVVGGSSTTYTTSIGALNGFGGVVTLSASGLPAGATATFSPATVTGTGTSILTVTTTSGTTPVGTSSLTITGTSGSLTHSANVTLSVTNAAAIGIKFVGQGTAMGSSESAGVVPQSNWNNATGMTSSTPLALLNQAGAASGATVTWNTNGIWVLPITDSAGNNRMMRGYLDTTSGPTTVTVTGLPANAAGYNVYVYADGDNSGVTRTGAYQISGSGIATTSVNLTDAAGVNFTGTFTQANNSNGNYVLFPITATGFTITATPGATTNLPRAPLNAIQIVPLTTPTPDFSLTASPSTQSVVVGSAATYTAGIGALNGFAGIVTLSAGGLPAGATATFSPATVTGSGTSTLTVTTSGTTPVGTSPLTITGTSGTLIHTAGMTLTTTATPPPPDFSLSATPGTATVVQGSGTTYTASIGAVAGFTGTVTLSASGLPAGVTATFSPTTVTGSGSSTLTVTTSGTTPIGTSPLTITGTSGSLTHSAGVTLAVIATPPPPDYTLSATPGSQTVVGGSSTTYTTSIGALNGFGGVVTLSASGLPAGATATFSPATVTGTGTSILTVTTTSGTTPVGTSSLTITGTSGSLTHSANVTLSVTNAAAIGIKFVGQGTAMGSSESAGVVPQSNWNNATGMTSSTPLALLNQAGAASGATVTWNTNGIWVLPITDSAGNNRMMRGYLDTTSGPTTVTVTGLPANAAGYNVYVYADGDNGGVTRTGAYQISGSGIATTSVNLTDAAGVNFTGTFTQANNSNGNYVLFPITATGFTITATPGATTNLPRAPLNAIQIVPN